MMKKIDYILMGVSLGVFFMTIILTICILIINKSSYKDGQINGYEQGQIDALNGIQNYDKIATKDSVYIKIR